MFMQIVHIQTFIYVSRVALTFNHLVPRSIILVSVSLRRGTALSGIIRVTIPAQEKRIFSFSLFLPSPFASPSFSINRARLTRAIDYARVGIAIIINTLNIDN